MKTEVFFEEKARKIPTDIYLTIVSTHHEAESHLQLIAILL
jgi:hypothetical protein